MGKKGSWFSAIKRVFTHSSNEKRDNGGDKKSSSKEKKKGKGTFRPLFREPSSIEKILGEADQLLIRPPPTSFQRPTSPPSLPLRPVSPHAASPKAASSHRASSPKSSSPRAPSPRVASPRGDSPKAAPSKTFSTGPVSPKAAAPSTSFATSSKATAPSTSFSTSSKATAPSTSFSTSSKATAPSKASVSSKAVTPLKAPPPKVTQSKKEIKYVQRPEPTLRDQQLSATKIQAVYRGFMARRSFRALKGLVRLQGVVKGQNVKRQTLNAMKQMQLLVRVQTQIQSRRIQMIESQALQNQAFNNDNEAKSTLSKWTNQLSEGNENWDDSVLTKEEKEERLRKRVEAVIKRERAMAYAYSNQLWKSTPKSAKNSSDVRSNGFPWWWNWLERQLPKSGASQSQTPTRTVSLTPPRPNTDFKSSPFHRNLGNLMFDNHESVTPRSARSAAPFKSKPFQTTPNRASPLASSSSYAKFSKPLKDDDSLVSCPPFSVPNYMTPTASASAKAKSRAYSNPRERFPGTPGSSDSKRRFSFPLTPSVASFKWNKGSNRETASQVGSEKREDSRSIGDFSVDSTVSMPAGLGGGRKPFNRFV